MTKNQKAEHIAIIGAGVSGITTGILLQEHGFEVTIYAEQEFSKNLINPKFASLYPAASIIPHSVSHYDLIRLFKESQQFFNHLYEQKFLGITKHRHFELFSYRINKPDYLIGMHNVNKVSEEEWTPSHPSITTPNGWAYDCFFTDWNTYFNQLIQLFKRNNGSIIKRKVDLNLLNNINHNIIINCSGAGSNDLLEETNTPLIVLGHLLKIKTSKPMNSPLSKPISYNFSPGIDIYKNYTNDPLDVYFYPRSTDWVLGGSRFIGTLDENGQWAPDSATSDVFPREILDLNKEILHHSFDINIEDYPIKSEYKALRYVRDINNGIRIEPTETNSRMVIHNYGHGGAGVTLSWGSAYRILNIILRSQSNVQQEVIETISQLDFS